VFESIRNAKPPRLYFSSNAPNPEKIGEEALVEKVRSLVNAVDWPCKVTTLFRDEYLPAKTSISTAVDWFFKNEPEGIILEDDCLPHPSFFPFCCEMLDRYREDQRIGMITGDNFQLQYSENNDSYYFSIFNNIWGWASWRDRWQQDYDLGMNKWPLLRAQGSIANLFPSKAMQQYFDNIFNSVYQNKIDTWDYQWLFASRINNRLTVTPNINLITNIGFDDGATHCIKNSSTSNIDLQEMIYPLRHPSTCFPSLTLDERLFNIHLKPSAFQIFKNRINHFLKNR
jgi:hypothetical protein